MHQAVKDRVGQCRITKSVMPVLNRQLTGDNRGPAIVAIFDDLQ